MHKSAGYRFAIDRGGTFTDVYARLPDGSERVLKLLSEDPANYADAPFEGIRRIMLAAGEDTSNLSGAHIESIRMGTTVATNALLERRGSPTLLVTSAGLGDLLQIGDQSRDELFSLKPQNRAPLYTEVLEVEERIRPAQSGEEATYTGTDGSGFVCERHPDPAPILDKLLLARSHGCESIAVVFAHAYLCPAHEQILGALAAEAGFKQISLSHAVMPIARMVPRGNTCVVDAYLTPVVKAYAHSFRSAFSDKLWSTELLFMASDGGLLPETSFNGSRALLSGPAGGVIGYAHTAHSPGKGPAVIGFDMGGTSTDVSRFDGELDLTDCSTIAGIPLQIPQLDIRTVAAGGGSRLFFRHGIFEVGPQSAGSHPGPVCYRKHGHLAVTDANLLLGRLQPEFFPRVFGPREDQPLDREATQEAFTQLAHEINTWQAQENLPSLSSAEIASGFLDVANEVMARPIREVSVQRGFDLAEHVLACFGGAGGQHACAMARKLGIDTIHIHRHAGILSACGMELAPQVATREEATSGVLSAAQLSLCNQRLQELEAETRRELGQHGFTPEQLESRHYMQLRYRGTDQGILIPIPADGDYTTAFQTTYKREFGFNLERPIEVDHLRVRTSSASTSLVAAPEAPLSPTQALTTTDVYFDGSWLSTPVYDFTTLNRSSIKGPALVIQDTATIVLEPGFHANIDAHGNLTIRAQAGKAQDNLRSASQSNTTPDPVKLALLSNRFISIAEQMGKALQRTAISTNIKERCDFSCALFDAGGNLVANAPHTPVHLGAMSHAVKAQIEDPQIELLPGDTILSNHPARGGSHLPDITLITPVWTDNAIVAYVANRGHHADIGGLTPGSMPPFSAFLAEEGCAIRSLKVVTRGRFEEQRLREIFAIPGSDRYGEPVPGSRGIEDNISDVQAQIAANRCGANLLHELYRHFGLSCVTAYMEHIQDHAERCVRSCLQHIRQEHACAQHGHDEWVELQAQDFLDDGTRIAVDLRIGPDGDATFDFRSAGTQQWGNLNTPRAVTTSAVLYCLRCMVAEAIPLNQGCLRPVQIFTRPGSILDPAPDLGVVGGNVLTSQRIVDVVLRAFDLVAASQGCMNNLTFGGSGFGYYETIGGGSGAGPGWHGASGIHTHMTNTRITDVEILEQRYPVVVTRFALRHGSGGAGQWYGGDGLVRELRFLEPMNVSIISERRVFAPYGLGGAKAGARGRNLLLRADTAEANPAEVNLGAKNSITVQPGERIRIETPGGGGYTDAKRLNDNL
ncbi:MAG: hydantoinase B/oxoprolinase family protein [Thermodesulfobacteriota bacterium]